MNNNELIFDNEVSISTELEDGMVVDAATARLNRQPHLWMQRIWCEFHDGTLRLRGQVPSFYLKQIAQTAVAGLDGVRRVVNEIEVVW